MPEAAQTQDLETPASRDASLRADVALGVELGLLTGLGVAAIDGTRALLGPMTGSGAVFALYLFAFVPTAGALLGAVLGAWSFLARRLGELEHGRVRTWLVSGLMALPLAALAVWVPSSWIDEHWRTLSPSMRAVTVGVRVLLVLGSVVATRIALAIAHRLEQARAGRRTALVLGACATAVAAICYAGDALLFPSDYDDFHVGLAAGVAIALGLGIALFRHALSAADGKRRLRRVALGLATVFCALLAVLELSRAATFGTSRALAFPKLVALARHLSDADGDGVAAVFGGRDCAWTDAGRSPRRAEVPENGIDDDCSGADERWPLRPPRPKPSSLRGDTKWSVLLISVDTLRADHLGAYGYRRPTTPNLDRLASGGLLFERAFSQASKTWDSVPSFMTGRYPSNVARDYEHRRVRRSPPYAYYLKKSTPPIARAFAVSGYATKAVVALALLREMGLGRGFDRFEIDRTVTSTAKRMLKGQQGPMFLWLHYNQPHQPYTAHREHVFGKAPIDRYDSEIAAADAEIGRVLSTLEDVGRSESTIVIVTSDHGEEFGEHGGYSHTRKHYRELLHVPLIVKVPGLAPQRISEVVELVDIVPTLYELCELPPAPALDGQSLLSTLHGPRSGDLGGAYAEDVREDLTVARRAFFDGRHRLIENRSDDRLELYDTRTDPLEQRDLALDRGDVLDALRSRLAVRAQRSRSPRRAAP